MAEDIIRLERRVAAVEQKVSTEQAMRVALLTDITARLDMLEHRAGDVPPADPASEVPLTREEAEEIAKTCAQAAAALPHAPSYLTTVNMRGWRPHAWVVDAVVNGAYRSRRPDTNADQLTDHERDLNAICVRIAKILGLYHDDFEDDDHDGYELDGLLGILEADMTKLRKDASGACDAQRAAMVNRDELRDQRDAMRSERDQALDRVRELEEQRESLCERVLEVEDASPSQSELDSLREQVTQLERSRATIWGGTLDELDHYRRLASKLKGQLADAIIRADALRDDLQRAQAQIGADGVRITELEQRLAQASADTVQAMESAAGAAARVQELERDNQALRERHDQLFAGAQQAYQDREAEHQRLAGLLQVIGCETFEGAVLRVRETNDHMLYLQGEMLEIMEECDNSSDSAKDVISTIHDLKTENAKLKSESLADVIAKLEQLRGQVTNMHADQMWLKRCEEMEVQLGGSLGIARENVPSWYALIDQVRELKARASGGVAHE